MIWGQISPAHGDRGAKPPEGGGGRSFWLLCVVVVFCVVARDLGTYVGVEFFVRESKRFMVNIYYKI